MEERLSDAKLAARAQKLVSDAEGEAPLTTTRFQALLSEINLLALEAENPDDIHEVVAEQLARLEPGSELEDSS